MFVFPERNKPFSENPQIRKSNWEQVWLFCQKKWKRHNFRFFQTRSENNFVNPVRIIIRIQWLRKHQFLASNNNWSIWTPERHQVLVRNWSWTWSCLFQRIISTKTRPGLKGTVRNCLAVNCKNTFCYFRSFTNLKHQHFLILKSSFIAVHISKYKMFIPGFIYY